MDYKIEVIGIDHGWSGMKTVHEVFPSGCKEISTEPAFTENLLEYGGKYYKIGSRRLEVKDTKVTDENYYMLTLAAVESAEPGFTILNKKSLAYYEGMKEKGKPVYIDTIPYEDFMLLGQVDMEKRFMDLDGLEQQERLDEDMESGLELEYAFDTEDGADGGFAAGQAKTSGNRTAGNSEQQGSDGLPEGFVIGDSISCRLFHWKFSVEQKEEVKRAMAVRVPKEVILSYFYPETSVVRMMEIRRRYE